MDQVMNRRERDTAFGKFLAFFIATVALVIIAVYFNYRVPTRENALLKEEVRTQRAIEFNQQAFLTKMEEVKILLDSFDKGGPAVSMLQNRINSVYNEMTNMVGDVGTTYGKMNKTVTEYIHGRLLQNDNYQKLQDRANKAESDLIRLRQRNQDDQSSQQAANSINVR